MWSTIEETPIYLEKLQLLVDPAKVLKSTGYVLQPLEPEQVELKKRCLYCGGNAHASPHPVITLRDISTRFTKAC
jgi:hypothetical protein